MANIVRIKRRSLGGASGAPVSLAQSELAYSEVDGVLHIGVGIGGSATVVAIGGPGAYATKASPTFTGVPLAPTATSGTNNTQIATTAFVTAAVAAVDISGQLTNYLLKTDAASTYLTISSASSTYLTQSSASSTYAPLASPALTGSPTAPNVTAGDSSTKIANTSFVMTAVSNLVASAPDALNTLNELATALGNDASFSTTITTSIGGKLAKASNLSDLVSASTARTNLGLGTMATQAASAVAITGGTIDGVTIDCGEFDAPATITITSQPSAQTASGFAATFSVTATVSAGTLAYQWERQALGTGSYTAISGATSSTLSLTGLTNASNNADNYRVAVSAAGATAVTSNAAALTVAASTITISSQPSNQTASSGAATFSVTASVSPAGTVTYQWQKQALGTGSYANISGATSSTLSLTGLSNASNNADNYRVVVSSFNASDVTSNSAALTVPVASLISLTRDNGSSTFSGSGTTGSPYVRVAGVELDLADGLSHYYWTASATATVTLKFDYSDDSGSSQNYSVTRTRSGSTTTPVAGTGSNSPSQVTGVTVSVISGDVIRITASGDASQQHFANVSVSAA